MQELQAPPDKQPVLMEAEKSTEPMVLANVQAPLHPMQIFDLARNR